MLDTHRDKFLGLELFLAGIFEKLPLSPNAYTLLSLVAAIGGFVLIVEQNLLVAAGLFVLAFLLDLVDGAVARAKSAISKKGAYLDTIVDRYIEAFMLLGLLFVQFPAIFLPGFVWIFLVLLGSLMTTYSKAAAREKGLSQTELKGGLMSRAERVLFYLAILVLLPFDPLWAAYFLVILAVLSNITACQRIASAWSKN